MITRNFIAVKNQSLNLTLILAALLFSLPSVCLYAEDENPSANSEAAAQESGQPAEEAQAPKQVLTVLAVQVRGNQVVNTSTILNKIITREGQTLSQETINEDIKRLYATGFFRDIRFDVEPKPDGMNVILVVDEKPVVKQITIQGAKIFQERKLRKEINVLEGQILDEKEVVEGVRKIEQKYLNKGFRFAKVTYEINVNEASKEAIVSIRIDEGATYLIRKVSFSGNQAFPDRQLRKLMKTKTRNLWMFRRGIFKEDVFNDDLDRVSLFFQDEGFLDVKVAPDFVYDEGNNQMNVAITIEEGARYVAGDIKFEGNALFQDSDIWQRLSMLPGTTYSQRNLANDLDSIRKFYYSKGYMDARVIPETKLNHGTNKVDASYTITEGDLYFVDKVKIRGNNKTKDMVIRRELRIYPGERFDLEKLEKSKQRLTNLGYFDEITYDTEPSTTPNRKDIVFRVKEKQTGELSFGAGFSSVDQFVGFAEIAQRNFDLTNWPRFTGGGQSVSLRGRLGSISRNVEFNFTEPYFLNKKYSFSFDAYNTSYENRNVDFSYDRLGAGITFGKAINDEVSIGTGYTLENVKVEDVADSAAQIIRDFEGDNLLSRLRVFIARDTRDNVYNPTKGSFMRAVAEMVGTFLGGDHDYYILQAGGTKYWTVFKKSVIEWRNQLAVAEGLGSTENVPIFDRFFAGGLGTIRGYNYRRVSPKEDNRPIGGESLLISSVEYTFPIPIMDNFKGAFFIDAGQVSENSYDFFSSNDFVVSIGPGVKINTPIGPVAFYYGLPIFNRDTEDENGRFEFSLSRSF